MTRPSTATGDAGHGRHREPATARPGGPPATATALTPGGHTDDDLIALREAVRLDARSATRLLLRQLAQHPGTGPARADRLVLLAEAHLRTTQLRDAQQAADRAEHAAASLGDSDRLTRAQLVAGDIRLIAGNAEIFRFRRIGTPLDHRTERDAAQAVIVEGLSRVLSYQRSSCVRGRRLADDLHNYVAATFGAGHLLTAMCEQTVLEMRRSCRAPDYPPMTGPPPPVPGGILHPDPTRPDPDYLASRTRSWPGRHHHPPGLLDTTGWYQQPGARHGPPMVTARTAATRCGEPGTRHDATTHQLAPADAGPAMATGRTPQQLAPFFADLQLVESSISIGRSRRPDVDVPGRFVATVRDLDWETSLHRRSR